MCNLPGGRGAGKSECQGGCVAAVKADIHVHWFRHKNSRRYSGQFKVNKCWNALWYPVLVPQIVGTICEVEV